MTCLPSLASPHPLYPDTLRSPLSKSHDVYLYSCSTSEWLPSNTIATIEYKYKYALRPLPREMNLLFQMENVLRPLASSIGFYLAADYCSELAMPNSRVL